MPALTRACDAARECAAEFLFPLTYICGDVFTEVYGYGASRRAIWLGFFTMAVLAVMGQLAVDPPPAPEWHGQKAFASQLQPVRVAGRERLTCR